MLPKQNRLPSFLIPVILKKGKRFFSTSFVLIIKSQPTNSNHQPSRFAFIISSKIIKLSVRRNKVKKRLRSIIRSLSSQIISNFDIIILSQKNISQKNYSQLKKELVSTLLDQKLLKPDANSHIPNCLRK